MTGAGPVRRHPGPGNCREYFIPVKQRMVLCAWNIMNFRDIVVI